MPFINKADGIASKQNIIALVTLSCKHGKSQRQTYLFDCHCIRYSSQRQTYLFDCYCITYSSQRQMYFFTVSDIAAAGNYICFIVSDIAAAGNYICFTVSDIAAAGKLYLFHCIRYSSSWEITFVLLFQI